MQLLEFQITNYPSIANPKEAQRHLIEWINGLKALTEAGQ